MEKRHEIRQAAATDAYPDVALLKQRQAVLVARILRGVNDAVLPGIGGRLTKRGGSPSIL